jgi:hypothetical protein
MKWKANIYDGKQGRAQIIVDAENEEDAEDEAYIAGLENGFDCIEEITVEEVILPT